MTNPSMENPGMSEMKTFSPWPEERDRLVASLASSLHLQEAAFVSRLEDHQALFEDRLYREVFSEVSFQIKQAFDGLSPAILVEISLLRVAQRLVQLDPFRGFLPGVVATEAADLLRDQGYVVVPALEGTSRDLKLVMDLKVWSADEDEVEADEDEANAGHWHDYRPSLYSEDELKCSICNITIAKGDPGDPALVTASSSVDAEHEE